jgi:hypothetical protein
MNEIMRNLIYKWREENYEKYREIQNKSSKKYREKNKDIIKERNRVYYLKKKQESLGQS